MSDGAGEGQGEDASRPFEPLPRPVQDHIGRQLRAVFNDVAGKPAFLGDADVPPAFERLIRRMETSERVHDLGIEAVRKALGTGGGEP